MRHAAVVLFTGWLWAVTAVPADGQETSTPTYVHDVAPIVYAKCLSCHRGADDGTISLIDYDAVRRHSPEVGVAVASRRMPPWQIDRDVGVQELQDDRSLTAAERDVLLAWVEGGTPYGERGERPPDPPPPVDPAAFRLAARLGAPDLVLTSPEASLPVGLVDGRHRSVTAPGFDRDLWVRALEIRVVPTDRDDDDTRIHDVVVHVRTDESVAAAASRRRAAAEVVDTTATDTLRAPPLPGVGEPSDVTGFRPWATGQEAYLLPPDAGKLLPAGAELGWDVHVVGSGSGQSAGRVELAVWLHPEDGVPPKRTDLLRFDARGPAGLDLPPGQRVSVRRHHTLPEAVRLESFHPHMHRRGAAMQVEAIFADGVREILSRADFLWPWHPGYVYAEGAAPLLPALTTLVVTAWYDNTDDNPDNPDAEQWVGYGLRAIDEVGHVWIEVTTLTAEELASERTARARR